MQESGRWLELLLYFLRLGLLGFGGPVALVGQMEREVVAERGVASLAALFSLEGEQSAAYCSDRCHWTTRISNPAAGLGDGQITAPQSA